MRTTAGWGVARIVASWCLGLAVAACSGDGGRTDPEAPLPSTYPGSRIVFVTSMSGDGDLIGWMPQCSGRSTGVEAADCICQEHARLWGNLSGTYRAWLSDADHPAASRTTHFTGPYVNRKGEVIAGSFAALSTLECTGLLTLDEEGHAWTTAEHRLVWTGSDASGNALDWSCEGWTSGEPSPSGTVGCAGIDPYWPNFAGCWSEWVEGGGRRPCDDGNGLFCVEQ